MRSVSTEYASSPRPSHPEYNDSKGTFCAPSTPIYSAHDHGRLVVPANLPLSAGAGAVIDTLLFCVVDLETRASSRSLPSAV
jgi:hypothetical protein